MQKKTKKCTPRTYVIVCPKCQKEVMMLLGYTGGTLIDWVKKSSSSDQSRVVRIHHNTRFDSCHANLLDDKIKCHYCYTEIGNEVPILRPARIAELCEYIREAEKLSICLQNVIAHLNVLFNQYPNWIKINDNCQGVSLLTLALLDQAVRDSIQKIKQSEAANVEI